MYLVHMEGARTIFHTTEAGKIFVVFEGLRSPRTAYMCNICAFSNKPRGVPLCRDKRFLILHSVFHMGLTSTRRTELKIVYTVL